MATPAFDATKHDVGLNGKGFVVKGGRGTVRQDAVPAFNHTAVGESSLDLYNTESFIAQSDWSGGIGQARLVSGDKALSAIADTRFGGHVFPARKKITESDGGTTSYYFRIGTTLYGLTAGFIETIGGAGSQARSAGTINCRPVTTGAGNAFWVRSTSVDKWTGSGATSDVTPSGVSANVVTRYGRFLWCIGTRSRNLDGALIQSTSRHFAAAGPCVVTLASKVTAGNVLVLGIGTGAGSTDATPTNSSDIWTLVDSQSINFGATSSRLKTYIQIITSSTQGSINFTSTATETSFILAEISGIDISAPFQDSSTTTDTAADTTESFPSITAGTYGAVIGFGVNDAGDTSLTSLSNSFSTITGVAVSTYALNMVYKFDTTSVSTAGTQTSAQDITTTIGLRQSAGSGTVTQTCFLYSADEGASWQEAFSYDTGAMPNAVAALASGGYLWVTTNEGLYQLQLDEREFEDHVKIVQLSILGPVDHWTVPYDTTNVGTWLAAWEGQIYYNVGATIRRYSPGAGGSQLWPTPSWDGVSGKIQAVVAGEAGVYWGAASYLWCFNGSGIHTLAAEPNASDYDFLHWHGGRLYFNDDPGSYYDFKYPASRPDVSYTAATNFDTGYLITSMMDYQKQADIKVIRHFEVYAEWSATSNSGTITLEYLVADSGTHPERLGGSASGLSWTSIGTMTVSDGNYKLFTLGTPITPRAHWLRVTLAPGSSGYPILQSTVAYGRTILPVVKRFPLVLWISTDTIDLNGDTVYGTPADVTTARAELLALRSSSNYFTMKWVNDDGTTTDYVVSPDQQADAVYTRRAGKGSAGDFTLTLLELP